MKAGLGQRWAPYVFLSPFLILFALFGIFPLVFSLFLSFQAWDPIQGLMSMSFVGWDNYLFTLDDEWFWLSLGNTVVLALLSGVPQHLVAIPLAYWLHQKLDRFRNVVVGIYFLPYITSTVAIAIMFAALLSTDYGVVNQLIQGFFKVTGLGTVWGHEPIDWLGDPRHVKLAIAFVIFWRYLGFNTVLYLSAIQSISSELTEAARMDGASEWQIFRKIIVPQLKPMMYFGVTLSVIGGIQLFEEPFVLTAGQGGPEMSGMTTAMYLYKTAFDFNDFGVASSISWLLFALMVVLSWLNRKVFQPD